MYEKCLHYTLYLRGTWQREAIEIRERERGMLYALSTGQAILSTDGWNLPTAKKGKHFAEYKEMLLLAKSRHCWT